jgi:hypothetical protein
MSPEARSVPLVEILPVGADQLPGVRELFDVERTTRHCWCMAFCTTRWQFATGWYGGGNRRRFEAMAANERLPLGVLAMRDGEPVGWCACGPRRRYRAAVDGRSSPLARRPPDDDDHVWLIACIIIRPEHRGSGVALPLLRGAMSVAREENATAIEAWPLARGVRRPEDAHVGREGVFTRLGFERVEQPSTERVIMRYEFGQDGE